LARLWRACAVWGLLLALTACASTPQQASPDAPRLWQYATFSEFAAGGYAGTLPLSAVAASGDMGLGTVHGLDGEMIVLDGVIYRADASLALSRPTLDVATPFAQVVRFEPQARGNPAGVKSLAELTAWLDTHIPGDGFAAARIDVKDARLKIRSVPGFTPPYPTLEQALTRQRVKELEHASGTLVAVRGPKNHGGIWVPGWHMHFVSADKTTGGHVLDVAVDKGEARWMTMSRFELDLPPR